jgi:hypothetical protein
MYRMISKTRAPSGPGAEEYLPRSPTPDYMLGGPYFPTTAGVYLAVNRIIKKMSYKVSSSRIILRDPEYSFEEQGCLDTLQQDFPENTNNIWILQVLLFSRETDKGSPSISYSLESKDYIYSLILLIEEKDIYSRIGSLRVESKEL